MSQEKYEREQIVTIRRQIEVAVANGKSTPQACKQAEITTQLRNECLHGEIFYALKEAQIVIGPWRRHF